MRVIVWLITLALVFTLAFGLSAQEILGNTEAVPANGNKIPSADTEPEQIRPETLTAHPQLEMPSPIMPSIPPTGYIAPSLQAIQDIGQDSVEMTADSLRTNFEDGEPSLTTGIGRVEIKFRDIIVEGREGSYNHKTGIAEIAGDVRLRYEMQEVTGEKVAINVRTRTWDFYKANTTIMPEFARGYLKAPVFAEASRIEGMGQKSVSINDAQTTTCDLASPHYELIAQKMLIYPGDKIIFRNVTIYALGKKLFSLPRLVIPVRDINRNPRIIPQIGQSAEEGTFLKTSYNYFGNRNQTGLLLLDFMSRKGIGHGIKHSYQFARASGELELYRIEDRNINENTLTGKLEHSQKIGSVVFNASSNLRQNSFFYAPNSKSWNNRISLTLDRPTSNSSITLMQDINDAFVRTENIAGTFRHRQKFGETAFFDGSVNYTAFDTMSGESARLQSQLLFEKRGDKFDWSISAQELTDLRDEAFAGYGRFAGIEKLPELALVSETGRLRNIIPFNIPARFKLTYGRFNELPANTELDRTFFEIVSPVTRYKLSNTWNLAAGAGFRQYFYSDDTAQYSIDTSADLSKKIGNNSSLGITYRFQRPRGYTPFRFDFIGRYNIANLRLNIEESSKFKMSLLTGYDFERENNPWRDITFRATYNPTPSFLLYTATGYDINRSKWRTLINQVRIRGGETFKLDIGTRYDPTRKQLANVRTWLDTKLGSKYHIQALAGYNGFTKDFDYRSLMLTRDLHCWEMSIVYVNQSGFYRDEGIYVNFRIKAFPLFTNYGIGQFGQALDTSVGDIY